MGYSSWTGDAYEELRSSRASAPRSEIFTSNKVDPDMSPIGLTTRESRDSDIHPMSLAIIVALDVTSSMRKIPENLVRNKLGALMNTLIKHGIEHPQIMFLAIGDQYSDDGPLQVGQFESGNDELDTWLTKIWIEEGGGGGGFESYPLSWLVAARHTEIDCFLKRNQKGFLFTIGDERSHPVLDVRSLTKVFGSGSTDIAIADILEEAKRTYHVYHIHANEGSYRDNDAILNPWRDLIGENLLIMNDQNSIAELIATTVAVINGADAAEVLKTFDTNTAKAIGDAIKDIVKVEKVAGKSGIVNL